MLTDQQVNDMMQKYITPTAKIQNTGTKILVWDSVFVFEANKLGEFWNIK